MGSSQISFPIFGKTSRSLERPAPHGPELRPESGPVPHGATINLAKISPEDLLSVFTTPPRQCKIPSSIGSSSSSPGGLSPQDEDCVRGDQVFVRQDLLFGPSSSIYSTRRKEFIIRHQELMVSKALDACSGTEVPFDQESHDDFMKDARERRASKERQRSSSPGQTRRNAAFHAERSSGTKIALDPEARPASRDLPFELESYDEYMASVDCASSFVRTNEEDVPKLSAKMSDLASPSTNCKSPDLSFVKIDDIALQHLVGFPDSEDPMSERALKRAAFFRAILGTDTDESDDEFMPAFSSNPEGSSSSSDAWSSDSDDDDASRMTIISALPRQNDPDSDSDFPSPTSLLGSDDVSASGSFPGAEVALESPGSSPQCSPRGSKRSKIDLPSGNFRPWKRSQELMEGPPEGTSGWVFESERGERGFPGIPPGINFSSVLLPLDGIRPPPMIGSSSPLILGAREPSQSCTVAPPFLRLSDESSSSADRPAGRWASLLSLHPQSKMELLFRLPWYNSVLATVSSLAPPCTSEGRPAAWTTRLRCKLVPLDLTWEEIAFALEDCTPLRKNSAYFTCGGRILAPSRTLRESRVPPYSTIECHERVLGGADESDSDDDDEELNPGSSAEPVSTVARLLAAITSPFVDSSLPAPDRVEFSPAVESPPSLPPAVEQGGEDNVNGTLSPSRKDVDPDYDSEESNDSSDSSSSLGRIIQDSRRGLLADDDVQARHLAEGAGDIPTEPEREAPEFAARTPTYVLWDQFVSEGSVPPAFAASGLNLSDKEFSMLCIMGLELIGSGWMQKDNVARKDQPVPMSCESKGRCRHLPLLSHDIWTD